MFQMQFRARILEHLWWFTVVLWPKEGGNKKIKSKNKSGLHPFFLIGRIPSTKLILGQISVLAASPLCPVPRARLGFWMGVYVCLCG